MTNIIILGAGQLGSYLYKNLNVNDSKIDILDYPKFDITSPSNVKDVVEKYDVIINAAAYTNVDKAEDESSKCMLVNGTGPILLLSNILQYKNKKLIHISSEVVYGSNDPEYKPLSETSPKTPTCEYAKSKKIIDDVIENILKFKLNNNILLLRPGWLFGPDSDHNFIEKIKRLLEKNSEIKVVNDQIGTLTHVSLIQLSIEEFLNGKLPSDVYNIGNSGIASRFKIAYFVKKIIQSNCKIIECTSNEFKRTADIAKNSVLDCSKIDKFISFQRKSWMEDVKDVLENRK